MCDREKDWFPFLPDDPPPWSLTGCIEALTEPESDDDDAEIHRLSVYHYVDGQSRWGHSTKGDATTPFIRKTVHGKYIRWRYRGPVVPTVEEQGLATVVWEWNDAPGELAALTDKESKRWVFLAPKEAQPWWIEGYFLQADNVARTELPDGRILIVVG
jgi:hypothetical protein